MKQISIKIWLPLILVAFILAGLAVYFTWQKTEKISEITSSEIIQKEQISEIPADWKTYRNEEYGFEFKYPPNWEFLVNDPYGKKNPSFRDKKYDGSFEWPGVDIDWLPIYGLEIPKTESKTFELENEKNSIITISFTKEFKRIVATCKLYLDPNVIKICNQMLSTFKFIE